MGNLNTSASWSTLTVAEMAEDSRLLLRLAEKIVDCTDFVELHPGGSASLLNAQNRDITEDYFFHSAKARQMIKSRQVAILTDGHPGACPSVRRHP